ncbi:hypothetical protein [Anaerophilus nitritogenes]|uniref:hypothetical protein n=1 Tax=Anaerophilus nitritogenes TaxID=2498136 RepID=UPI00101CD22D|nr:hypothetical protein [Anaerophilus nitritogenes]
MNTSIKRKSISFIMGCLLLQPMSVFAAKPLNNTTYNTTYHSIQPASITGAAVVKVIIEGIAIYVTCEVSNGIIEGVTGNDLKGWSKVITETLVGKAYDAVKNGITIKDHPCLGPNPPGSCGRK